MHEWKINTFLIAGNNLVAWRGTSGTSYIADAYCPHIGAHLGVGGEVHGECIQCPFHSWKFDGEQDGKLTCIPYADKCKQF
jgi:phenylpropionate dioxygenase-like ring-hydroxylating dioxygenase large terminal subunit